MYELIEDLIDVLGRLLHVYSSPLLKVTTEVIDDTHFSVLITYLSEGQWLGIENQLSGRMEAQGYSVESRNYDNGNVLITFVITKMED